MIMGRHRPPCGVEELEVRALPSISSFPDTSSRILPLSDQLNSVSDTLVRFIATHYAGTQKLTPAENARYRTVNPDWVLLNYKLATTSGPVPYIHNGTWTSDWPDVTSHEDWFMHNADDQRLTNSHWQWDLNDITNPAWRQYWLNQVIGDLRLNGAQGIFADSFEAGIGGWWFDQYDVRFAGTNAGNPAVWPNGYTWLQQLQDLVGYMQDGLRATPEQFVYLPNVDGLNTGWANVDYARSDGAFMEGFGAWNNSPGDWALGMNRALPLSAAGKVLIMETGYADPDTSSAGIQEREFLLGTYLLLKGSHTYINTGADGGPNGVAYFPEYGLDLGPAVTPVASDVSQYAWDGVYRRDFQNGIVLVNATSSTATLNLGQTYNQVVPSGGGALLDSQIDASGHYIGGSVGYTPTSSVTLAPGSAVILMRAANAAPLHFDFGTSTSPVATGYTQVTEATAYNPAQGYGWLSGAIDSRDRGVGDDRQRDFNFTQDGTFAVDIANGSYLVTVLLGDASAPHDQIGVFLEGAQVDSVTTAAGQWATRTYAVTVNDGQLTLRLRDLGGNDPNAVLNALDVVPGTAPFQVIASTPGGQGSGPVDHFTLTFSSAVQAGSFTLADVDSLTGPNGAITPTAVNMDSPTVYEVDFPSQSAPGAYTLVVGPQILDANGHPMDQNGNGVPGEVPQDQYTASFTVLAAGVRHFDFGTATSPVAAGYTQATEATAYSQTQGYGWLSGSIDSRDRGQGDDLQRDFNFTQDGTFAVDVANGTYTVTLLLGDASAPHDQMGVFLEGAQVDSLTTAAGQWATRAYTVAVNDGQLTLRLRDLGGIDPNAVLNSLVITPVMQTAPSRFDFGPATSPVATGYRQVTETTTYTAAQGFGWLAGVIDSRDRGVGDDLQRDFDFTTDGTFAVDVANGSYSVTLQMGDASSGHDQMGVFLEGTQVDSVTTAAGQWASRTYAVTVSDGQLTLRLRDLGGIDPYVVLNSLVIVAAS
jgi:fibronectin type 3 domain-containing protein